jgi:DNA-directed RNA polymerase subunit beta'
VDVAQDVVITEEDCGTLRGIAINSLKENEEVVETLYERIVGRMSLQDIYDPLTDELIIRAGDYITEDIAQIIEDSPIDTVEIRSVLTCESKRGVCAKCYGRNLTNNRITQIGDAVGIIAAQSIGEPGTQLTLRTFHLGGTAGSVQSSNKLAAKFEGVIKFDSVRTTEVTDDNGETKTIVIGRMGELRILDAKRDKVLSTHNLPYGCDLFVKDGQKVNKGDVLCSWDPYNAVIISDIEGTVKFENLIEGVTYREEADEQTGYKEKVIIQTKDKTKIPAIIVEPKGKNDDIKSFNIPVNSHIKVKDNQKIKSGQIIVKIPRTMGMVRDITGGLPRVTELFEARNPSNPSVVTEIDGSVSFGGIKRGNREIIIESKDGQVKKYLVPLSKHILVQENDYVKAGLPLSEGAITPSDILSIKGPYAVQEYLVNEVQEVYRRQGVKINDKHIEVIVRQMMRKVIITDPGDSHFLENESVDKIDFLEANDFIFDKKIVTNSGDSVNLKVGQVVTLRQLREENSILKRNDKKIVEFRDAQAATSSPVLQGITKASLSTSSWISAASFQETTKVLSTASITAKEDFLLGLKENVIVGHKIPAGTGLRIFDNLIVGSREEFEELSSDKKDVKNVAETEE